jgi:hypothetical protein
MAGSRHNFVYQMDDGSRWMVVLDRSNALINGSGFSLPSEADLSLYPIPKGTRLRSVRFKSATTAAERRIICQSTDSPIWKGEIRTIQLMDFFTGALIDFVAISRTAEKQQFRAVLLDTGLSD